MMAMEGINTDVTDDGTKKTVGQVVAMFVLMNLIFSLTSILSALATTDVFPVLALATVGSGLAMLFLSDHRTVDIIQGKYQKKLAAEWAQQTASDDLGNDA